MPTAIDTCRANNGKNLDQPGKFSNGNFIKNRAEATIISPLDAIANHRNFCTHDGLKRGFDFLHNNLNQKIRVMDVSVATGLSWRGFYKAFNKHIGFPPGRILRQQRLETAKYLLRHSNFNLTEIAKISGYHNVNSLWVAFRNATNVSPGKFRKNARLLR